MLCNYHHYHLNLQFTEHLQCQTPYKVRLALQFYIVFSYKFWGDFIIITITIPILQIRKSKFRGEIYLLCSRACPLLIIK